MIDNEPKINELPEDMRAKFDALREEFNKAMEPVNSKDVIAGLETVRCVIKTHPCISQAEKPALCRMVENGIKLIEDLEERIAIMAESETTPGKILIEIECPKGETDLRCDECRGCIWSCILKKG